MPEENTRVEAHSIETLVLLRGARGKIQIIRDYLATHTRTNDDIVSHPYRILCARCSVLLCDGDYFMRVLELLLCSDWGITDIQFLQSAKRVLPVQKQMDQVLDTLLSSLRRENTIERTALVTLESTVGGLAMTTDAVLRSSSGAKGNAEGQSEGSGEGLGEGQGEGTGEEQRANVAQLQRALAKEDVGHGMVRLLSLTVLMTTVLEQHRHALSLSNEEDKGDKGDHRTTVVEGLQGLIESHRSMQEEVQRINAKLRTRKGSNSSTSSNSSNSSNTDDKIKSSELSQVSQQIGTCRTRLARAIGCMEEVAPGEVDDMQRVMYETTTDGKGGHKGGASDASDDDQETTLPCIDLHKRIRERFSMVLTHVYVKELVAQSSTHATLSRASSVLSSMGNEICPAFERQARVLREKIATATQLEQDQKALKKTLAKRIQEVYMKQRELDTVGVRCDKLKHKVADAQSHIDAAKAETAQLKQDAVREAKHFEEAVDELNHDVDRLEAENRRMRKQVGGGGGGGGSPLRREEQHRQRRRSRSEVKRTTDQIKREWRTDAKKGGGGGGDVVGVSKNNNDNDATGLGGEGDERGNIGSGAVGLRRALDFVVAENVRLKALVVQRRMQRMDKLPSVVNYKAAQALVAADQLLQETKETKETKETMAEQEEKGEESRITQQVRVLRACNAEALRLTHRARMTRATRTVVDLSLRMGKSSRSSSSSSTFTAETKEHQGTSQGWSTLSHRRLENANAKRAYEALVGRVQGLAREHSVELGQVPKDFGRHSYALVPGSGGETCVGVLKRGGGGGGVAQKVRVDGATLVRLHERILWG